MMTAHAGCIVRREPEGASVGRTYTARSDNHRTASGKTPRSRVPRRPRRSRRWSGSAVTRDGCRDQPTRCPSRRRSVMSRSTMRIGPDQWPNCRPYILATNTRAHTTVHRQIQSTLVIEITPGNHTSRCQSVRTESHQNESRFRVS